MKDNNGKFLVAILAGAAIGAGLGILYAPNKGTKTRRNIKNAVEDTTKDVSNWFEQAKDELMKTAHDNKKAFDKKIEKKVSKMSDKADDIMKSMEDKYDELKKKNA